MSFVIKHYVEEALGIKNTPVAVIWKVFRRDQHDISTLCSSSPFSNLNIFGGKWCVILCSDSKKNTYYVGTKIKNRVLSQNPSEMVILMSTWQDRIIWEKPKATSVWVPNWVSWGRKMPSNCQLYHPWLSSWKWAEHEQSISPFGSRVWTHWVSSSSSCSHSVLAMMGYVLTLWAQINLFSP